MLEGVQIGAYRILQQIGEGGMGSVWLAEHAMLGRRAAIKVLHQSFSSQPEIVTRFFNEARAATAISDPGIVQIFDFGYHVDQSAYIVMELLEGEALDRRLSRLGVLQVADTLRIMRPVASSLHAAHMRGIVHRDLKPENIFLVRDPEVMGGERPKLLDFGIAKLNGGDSAQKTLTSAVMGTPAFMSPEQCRGAGEVDLRSDIYSMGCVMYMLLTGQPPFNSEGVGEIIVMHLTETPLPPSTRMPGIPPEVDELVMRCLAKNPAERFATALELAHAIGTRLGANAPMMSYTNINTNEWSHVGPLPQPQPVMRMPTPQVPLQAQRAPLPTPAPPVNNALPATVIARPGQPMVAAPALPVGPIPAAAPAMQTHTTLSSAAAVAEGGVSGRSRGMLYAAVGVSVVGGIVAIAVTQAGGSKATPATAPDVVITTPTPTPPKPTPPTPQTPTPQTPTPQTLTPQTPTPQTPPVTPPPPTPSEQVTAPMKAALTSFTTWAKGHAGAKCPDITAFAPDAAGLDPWGHPFVVTCTDQPGGQIIGLTSLGPDGKANTADDISSWTLGKDITDVVHGARWVAAVANNGNSGNNGNNGNNSKPNTPGNNNQTKPNPNDKTPKPGGLKFDKDGIPIDR